MTKTAYYPPEYRKKEFNCAHCKVFAHQTWISNLCGELVNVMTLNLPYNPSEELLPSDLFAASNVHIE